jgi:GT2 family glycosyltransferase
MGWSIIMKKRVWDIVYPWDENFDLYYQDNDYCEILKYNNIKHAVVRDSIATHLISQTVTDGFQSNIEKNKNDYKKLVNKWNLKK